MIRRIPVGRILGYLVLVIGIISATAVIFSFITGTAEDRLQIVQSILSWPYVVLLILLVILWRFGGQLEVFITNVRQVSFPGASLLSQPPQELHSVNRSDLDVRDELLRQYAQKVTSAEQAIETCARQALIWEFNYLDLFLVPLSKLILAWFAERCTVPPHEYHQNWFFIGEEQRNIILSILLQHGMLTVDQTTITITEKALAFLHYIRFPEYSTAIAIMFAGKQGAQRT